jgi:hypothetical protein
MYIITEILSIKIAADYTKEPLDYHLHFKRSKPKKGIDNYLQSLGLNMDHLDHSKEKQEKQTINLKENQKEIIKRCKTN